MKKICPPLRKNQAAGIASVEFAIVLSLLLLLMFPLADFARAIQSHMVILSMSREGANLASRGPTSLESSSQSIMTSLAATSPPLDMNRNGMILITKIMGNKEAGGVIRNVILEQYRWDDRANSKGWSSSGYMPASTVWTCGSWAGNGSCSNIPSPSSAPTAAIMTGMLSDGEVIYAVEVFYKFSMLFSGFNIGFGAMQMIGPNLHAMTIF